MRRMLRMARAEQRKTSQLRRVWLFLKSSHGKLILILRRYVRFHELGRLWGTGNVTKNMKWYSSFTLCCTCVTFLNLLIFFRFSFFNWIAPLCFVIFLSYSFYHSLSLFLSSTSQVWKMICKTEQEGLVWGQSFKLEPVAYGIMKLVMTCSIVDSLVLMDDVTDKVREGWIYFQMNNVP